MKFKQRIEEEVHKHFCEYQSVLCEMAKAEKEYNEGLEALNNKLSSVRDSYERGSEEDKFMQFLHTAMEEQYALTAAFSKQLRQECEKRGLHPMPLQMLKDLITGSVRKFKEEERIRESNALRSAYEKNILLFNRHRAEILCNPLWYHAIVPIRIYGIKGLVTIGAMLRAWASNDPLFVEHDGDDDLLIINYAGSPLSGMTSATVVSMHTGKTKGIHTGGFLARTKLLGDIMNSTPIPPDCTPVRLVDLVQILKDKEV